MVKSEQADVPEKSEENNWMIFILLYTVFRSAAYSKTKIPTQKISWVSFHM